MDMANTFANSVV